MVEKVIYLLGAGFSAYAGIPVMSNFILKSKDMYFSDNNKYGYMYNLFKKIDVMAKVKNYFSSNLMNIEEILSIMEMQNAIGEKQRIKSEFIKYIIDVIKHYSFSPDDFYIGARSINIARELFSKNQKINTYGYFVLSLLNGIIEKNAEDISRSHLRLKQNMIPKANYSIITLNYDVLIEQFLEYINENFNLPSATLFDANIDIYKLHGCIRTKEIIPPTWAKSIGKGLISTWKGAYKAITEASKIRIIGYSLPISDSYLRYFLKSAIIENDRLKNIDVICYDPIGSVRTNYFDFVTFENIRFKNARVEDYFEHIYNDLSIGREIPFDILEDKHDQFMNME